MAIAVVVLGIDHAQPARLPRLEMHVDPAIPVDARGSVIPQAT